jgi:hypothetical protein
MIRPWGQGTGKLAVQPTSKNLLRIRSGMFRTAYIGPRDRHWIRSHCADFCGYTASKPCQIAGNSTKYPATLSTGKWPALFRQ